MTEETLVNYALYATAAQVEQLRVAAAAAAEGLQKRVARSELSFRVDDDGSVSGYFRLPPEQAAVVLHALRLPRDARCDHRW